MINFVDQKFGKISPNVDQTSNFVKQTLLVARYYHPTIRYEALVHTPSCCPFFDLNCILIAISPRVSINLLHNINLALHQSVQRVKGAYPTRMVLNQ